MTTKHPVALTAFYAFWVLLVFSLWVLTGVWLSSLGADAAIGYWVFLWLIPAGLSVVPPVVYTALGRASEAEYHA
jgi:hypothetical protein